MTDVRPAEHANELSKIDKTRFCVAFFVFSFAWMLALQIVAAVLLPQRLADIAPDSKDAIFGVLNSVQFVSMNTLTLKDLPDDLASSGNSLLSMVMQLSMSIGVTIAGLLLGLYGQQHMSLDAASTHQVFLYTYLSMAAIIALPALIFSRVPDDVGSNTVLRRRNRSGS